MPLITLEKIGESEPVPGAFRTVLVPRGSSKPEWLA
jgi:hypothetical protein